MTNGLTHDGRKLRADEVPRELRHYFAETPNLPEVRVPCYSTGGELYSRDDLLSLFESHWGRRQVNDGDVHSFVVQHFTVKGQGADHVVPTAYIPYPDMPEIPEDADDKTRRDLITGHEERRRLSRRAREVFDINGLPYYVPSNRYPSVNSRPAVNRELADHINNLGR